MGNWTSDEKAAETVEEEPEWGSQWHSIREASLHCGLPESTLRYYEQIGIITGVARDPVSGHRAYSDEDLAGLTVISCLSATGMSLSDMREYMNNRSSGQKRARFQVELLARQRERLDEERDFLEARSEYVSMKIRYWQAMDGGDMERAKVIGEKASRKARALSRRAVARKREAASAGQHTVKE